MEGTRERPNSGLRVGQALERDSGQEAWNFRDISQYLETLRDLRRACVVGKEAGWCVADGRGLGVARRHLEG